MIKDWEGAIQDYTTFIMRQPNSVSAHWKRAELYAHVGKRAEALADYQIAINAAPDERLRQQLWYEVYTFSNLSN
jgi:tetratricopeptide (TPR) repeat protein